MKVPIPAWRRLPPLRDPSGMSAVAATLQWSETTPLGQTLPWLALVVDVLLVLWLARDVDRREASRWWIAAALVGGPLGWLVYLAARPALPQEGA
jgi:hypothetical protein